MSRRWLDPVDGAGLAVTLRGAVVGAGYVVTLTILRRIGLRCRPGPLVAGVRGLEQIGHRGEPFVTPISPTVLMTLPTTSPVIPSGPGGSIVYAMSRICLTMSPKPTGATSPSSFIALAAPKARMRTNSGLTSCTTSRSRPRGRSRCRRRLRRLE